MVHMGKVGTIVKAAGGIVAATATLLTVLKDNPQLSDGLNSTIDKIKSATNSDNPKLRFDGRIKAIETCADAVAENFPELTEPDEWRRKATALRVRGELAWNANEGKTRKKAMAALNAETATVLEEVNRRLTELTEQTGKAPSIDPLT
ncbi:hypothetical protein EAX62_03665 [Tessaracoccus antarcticus]|uniref:Uncharacterized protein n=2 Tax=Tessaracoccus antarcticus TaxID=2479848 RepID=A0A3M0GJD7_9ACTN|nr:hypothetical protein EAX62_03665 [Tessaracoccus antarcticus]